ncbi:hypothetical protein SCHPADRAFT_947772 [Schizopora paradoxa]|uniref:Uncharacterized protein n=1 Tax=Schizopora paradoxa TaxID=27342 RepID=A0A0H2QXJ7_9AGAM|nr:hypothetical protein SCHPADRAFT_947772 [Schizopora paradoxa]
MLRAWGFTLSLCDIVVLEARAHHLSISHSRLSHLSLSYSHHTACGQFILAMLVCVAIRLIRSKLGHAPRLYSSRRSTTVLVYITVRRAGSEGLRENLLASMIYIERLHSMLQAHRKTLLVPTSGPASRDVVALESDIIRNTSILPSCSRKFDGERMSRVIKNLLLSLWERGYSLRAIAAESAPPFHLTSKVMTVYFESRRAELCIADFLVENLWPFVASRSLHPQALTRTRWTSDIDLPHLLLVDVSSSPLTMTVYVESTRASLWLRVQAHASGRRLSVPWIASSDDGMFRIRETRAIDREMSPSFLVARKRHFLFAFARERGYRIISSILLVSSPLFPVPISLDGTYRKLASGAIKALGTIVNVGGIFRKLAGRAIQSGSPSDPNDYGTYRQLSTRAIDCARRFEVLIMHMHSCRHISKHKSPLRRIQVGHSRPRDLSVPP